MKTNTRIARVALFLLVVFVSFSSALAQETEPNRLKLSVSFINSEFKLDPVSSVENLQGVSVDADAKIFSKANFRLGGVFNYQRRGFDNSLTNPLDSYSFGAQLSYRAGPVEPFGAFLVGFTTDYSPGSDKVFGRTLRVGVDVPFHKESNFFIRPFFAEFKRTEGLFSPPETSYGAGAGFRF